MRGGQTVFTVLANGVAGVVLVALMESAYPNATLAGLPDYVSQLEQPMVCVSNRSAVQDIVCDREFYAVPLDTQCEVLFTTGMTEHAESATVTDVFGNQIALISALNDDWDDDGAPAPSTTAIHNARKYADETRSLGRAPDSIAADAIGGVVLWFFVEDDAGRDVRWGSIECHNDGAVFALLDDRLAETAPITTRLSDDNANVGLASLLEFLRKA